MTPSTYPEELRRYLETLPAEAVLAREDIATWAHWMCVLVNEFEEEGLVYRGMSVNYRGWSTLLVVKVARDMTPLVAFVTERDTTGCMRTFLRMFAERRVEWKEDKFG